MTWEFGELLNTYPDGAHEPALMAELFPDDRHSADSTLRKVQLVELRILRILDYICRKHGLSYWLDGGTLLGAIRHEGFIPWDDDIDVVMPRSDFNAFLKLARQELPPDLYLETPDDLSDGYRCFAVPCKLRDRFSRIVSAHADSQADDQKGLFVDIIPIDTFHRAGIPLARDKALKLIFRHLSKINDATFSLRSGLHGWAHGALKLFSPVTTPEAPIRAFRALLRRFVINRPFRKSNDFFLGYGFDVHWTRIFKFSDVYPLKLTRFEGFDLPSPADSDAVLKVFYGSRYMELPPIDQQRPKHLISIIVDTRKSDEPELLF